MTDRWTFDILAEILDNFYFAIKPFSSEENRARYKAVYDLVLVLAGWTDDEYGEELERRIGVK